MVEHRQYTASMLAGMQAAYGDGFLSPGAVPDVRRLIQPIDVNGKRVLDIGCGVGGATVMLAGEFQAGLVTAVDPEPAALAQAAARVNAAGLASRVALMEIEPGPLPFPDTAFDLAYSKDVVCHVHEKPTLFGDVHRLLCDGGWFVLGDWMPGGQQQGDLFATWSKALAAGGLNFYFEPRQVYEDALRGAGFAEVQTDDLSEVFLESAGEELEQLQRDGSLQRVLGVEAATRRISMTQARLDALGSGELTYCHIRARKA